MSDIDSEQVEQLIARLGEPSRCHFDADFLEFECDLVKTSAAKGRHHDITCFIQMDGGYVGIQKHAYADTGIYRAPSGGVAPGESIEDAAVREMYEETGLAIELTKFVLDVTLDVRCKDGTIPWRSLVFLANALSGVMKAVDTYEIYAVRLLSRDEMLGPINELMKTSGWGGFEYRAFLTHSFFEELDRLSI